MRVWVDVPLSVPRAKIPSRDPSRSSTRTRRRSSCTCTPHEYRGPITHYIPRYAYFKKLDYFSTECIYSPDAYRGHARVFLKDLEAARPSAIIDIIHSGEAFEVKDDVKATQKIQRTYPHLLTSIYTKGVLPAEICKRCGYMSSNELCKACTLLEGLERGLANAAIV